MKNRLNLGSNWLFVLGWLILLGASVVHQAVPTSRWFEVRSVRVFDAVVGEKVEMAVDRTIARPFRATYHVEVEERMAPGRYALVCVSDGAAHEYLPENDLPSPLTLDWWIYPVRCDLAPGVYRVDTYWTIDLGQYEKREVRATSNDFTIRPAPP